MTLKQRIIELLESQQYTQDGEELNGSLQNKHIALHLDAPVASVRRATRELANAGTINMLGRVIEENRRESCEYQLPIWWTHQ